MLNRDETISIGQRVVVGRDDVSTEYHNSGKVIGLHFGDYIILLDTPFEGNLAKVFPWDWLTVA